MNRLLLLCAGLLASALPLPGRTAPLPVATRSLASALDAQCAQPRFAHARFGILIQSLDSGRTLYARDADKLFQPASTAKLFTAALVMARLDPAYRIPTRLLGGPVRHGHLAGPLVLYGMGDPSLGRADSTADWADRLARQLAARGIRRIDGDLVADDAYFAGPPYAPGWEAIDRLAAFGAPPTALAPGENTLELTVSPGPAPGHAADIAIVPADAAPPLQNRLLTAPATAPPDINLYRAPGADTVFAFGQVPAGAPPAHFHLAVGDPALAAARSLAAALQRARIRVRGSLRVLHWPQDDGPLRANRQPLAEVRSPAIASLLGAGLKRSENLYLQNLLQLVGKREQASAPDDPRDPAGFRTTQAWGIASLHRLLAQIGIPETEARLEEGTGLSRRDLVTPRALVRILSYLAAQPYAAQVRQMLPVAGVDGTLAGRLRGTPAQGEVRAKTGSMAQVASLAGYVTTATGEHLAFALMLEHYAPPAGAPPAHAELDAIVARLAALGAPGNQAAGR